MMDVHKEVKFSLGDNHDFLYRYSVVSTVTLVQGIIYW